MKVTWKDILLNPVIGLFILFLTAVSVYLIFFTEPYTIIGKVVHHTTSTGRRGIIYYHTNIETEDGMTYSLEGLDYYTKPVGSTVRYKVRKAKCL